MRRTALECTYPGANLTVPVYLSTPGLVPDAPDTTTRSPTWEGERKTLFEDKLTAITLVDTH